MSKYKHFIHKSQIGVSFSKKRSTHPPTPLPCNVLESFNRFIVPLADILTEGAR